jgi:RNA polymerase sigma-70 factor (ECF subfamily)
MREGLNWDDDPVVDPDPADMLQLLLARDKSATERFVRTHAGWMLAVAKRIVRNSTTTEDVVQEFFVNMFKGLSSFDSRSAMTTWMHRIVITQALMEVRKQRRRQESAIDNHLPQFDQQGCRIEEQSARPD